MRDPLIKTFRIEGIGAISSQTSTEEAFQNKTLRPILKFQNDLFIASFRNYISAHKNTFYTYSTDQKIAFIDKALQRDTQYNNLLKGMIIGLFTIEEFQEYHANTSNFNKRIINMIAERLKSQLQVL